MALKEKKEGDIIILYPKGFLMGGAETDELQKRVSELEAEGNQRLIINLGEQGGRSVTDSIADHLANQALLLILDNCEHLVDPCARLTCV